MLHSFSYLPHSVILTLMEKQIYSFNAFCFRMSVEMEHFETIRKVLCQYMDLWNSESKKKWRILTLLRHSLWNGIGYITLYLNSLDVVTHSLEHFKSKMESSFELLWIPLLIIGRKLQKIGLYVLWLHYYDVGTQIDCRIAAEKCLLWFDVKAESIVNISDKLTKMFVGIIPLCYM